MEDIQLRSGLLEDLCETKPLDGASSRVIWWLKSNMCWSQRNDLSFLLRNVWQLNVQETVRFIGLWGHRGPEPKINLEQRCLGLFGRHFVWLVSI